MSKLFGFGTKWRHNPELVAEPTAAVNEFYSQLLGIFRECYIAGGYPTYLFGFTRTYGDVDFFVDGEYPLEEALAVLQKHWPDKRFSVNESPEYPARGQIGTVHLGQKMQVIFFDGHLSATNLLQSFDWKICQNLIFKGHPEALCYQTLSYVMVTDDTRPPTELHINGWITEKQRLRQTKYRLRFNLTKLSTLCKLVLVNNRLYPYTAKLNKDTYQRI